MSKAPHNSILPERQALRDGSKLRIVTSQEEGTDIQHLPEGIYGFTGAPATAEIPLFIRPYFECFEIHKLGNGETAWVGYITEPERATVEGGREPVTVDLYPDPFDSATSLVRIPSSRVDRRRPPTRDKGNFMRMDIAAKD